MSDFMQKRLSQLLKDLDNLTPQELSAELLQLARVADKRLFETYDATIKEKCGAMVRTQVVKANDLEAVLLASDKPMNPSDIVTWGRFTGLNDDE